MPWRLRHLSSAIVTVSIRLDRSAWQQIRAADDVYAVGDIMPGESQNGAFGGASIVGADTPTLV
mgnify:CR=1 FL=1